MRAGAAQAFVGAALAAAYGGETTTAPSAAAETLELRVETAHFRVLAGVLGLSGPEFEAAWQAFVRQRYF